MPEIQAQNFPYYEHGGTSATLYFYAVENFVAQGGIPIIKGKYPSMDWKVKVDCPINNGFLEAPAINLESTIDSDNPLAEWEAVLIDQGENRINFIVKRFRLEPGSETTWNAIRQFNELPTIIEDFGITTDNVPEGTSNLYFTNGRAQAALAPNLLGLQNNINALGELVGEDILDLQDDIEDLQSQIDDIENTIELDVDWDEVQNKPNFGTSALLDVAETGNASNTQIVKGDDTRLVPPGGAINQYLKKNSNTDFDNVWADLLVSWGIISGKPTFGTASSLNVPVSGNASPSQVVKGDDTRLIPTGGSTKQVLRKSSNTDHATEWGTSEVEWENVNNKPLNRLLPAGGSAVQVLAKINNTDFNTHWIDMTSGGGIGGAVPVLDDSDSPDNVDLTFDSKVSFLDDSDAPDNISLDDGAIPFLDDDDNPSNIAVEASSSGGSGGGVESVNGMDGPVELDTDDIPEGVNKYNQTHTGDVTGSTALTIANNAVTESKIIDNAISANKIADNAVTTNKILNANVTTAKVADNAITSAKILDSNVITSKIADSNVTNAKIATGIDAVKIGGGAVSNTEFSYLDGVTSAIQTQLDAKAPLASPALTGNPTTPNQTAGNNSTRLANTAYVDAAIANLINSAPGALDTLVELAAALGNDPNFATTVTNALAEKLAKSSNLSDLTNAGTARSNLGLGALALLASIATSNINNSAVTYAKIQNVSATDRLLGRSSAGAGVVEEIVLTAAGRALIDDSDASAQRATLGLGGLATLSAVGTSQITDSNVTTAKIADNAVTTVKIPDSNITTSKIADSNVTTAKINNGAITPAKRAGLSTLTDAGTVSLNASLSEKFKLTSANSRTIGTPSNPLNGQTIIIVFRNSSGGNQTLSLTTGSSGSFLFTDAVPNLTATGSGKTDLITCYFDSDVDRWLVVGYAKQP